MRQGPLESTAALFGDVRAGRAAARSVVPGLKRRQVGAEDPYVSFRCPGLTASFPAAQEPRGGEATRRFVVPQEEDGQDPEQTQGPTGLTLLRVCVQNASFHAPSYDHDLACHMA